jgi:hypothetical protein
VSVARQLDAWPMTASNNHMENSIWQMSGNISGPGDLPVNSVTAPPGGR